ncbi:MAG: hypothetical protein KBD37_04865 [Burkholderiales bacterium]|nr:hypothetical protein [Burkholderiales bacterium]
MKTSFIYLMSLPGLVYALDNSQFQAFDNQISMGYEYSSSTISNPSNMSIEQTTNNSLFDLNIEKLFNNGVWFDIDGTFAFSSNQTGANLPYVNNVQEIGFPASLTGKAGYAFVLPNTNLQLTPYATLGRVLNYNGVTIPDVGFNSSFYYLYGAGGRIEYAINNNFMLYFDQMVGYLSDQSGNSVNMDAWDLTSTLGIKYNVSSAFQIGLQGFYNQTNLTNSTAGYDGVTYTSRNVNQGTVGGIISLGYLYDAKNSKTSSWGNDYANGEFAFFDNVYSLGFGYAQSNTYNPSSTSVPGIASTLNYLDVNVQRLFLSGIWVDVDAQLATSIAQSNANPSMLNDYAPTYLTYPGSALASIGYAFPLIRDYLQIIPYANGGIVMNINSYTITQDANQSYQLEHDMYFQYGGGAKVEYVINKHWQAYLNQLFANLDDQSSLGLGVWRSTSTVGVDYNVYDPLQLGFNIYYDQISPTGSPSSSLSNPVYLNQSTVGGLFSVGLRY